MTMFTEIEQKISALNPREKILVAVAMIFCLWAGWDIFFYTPLKQKQQTLTQELGRLNLQLTIQQQTAQQFKNTVIIDPNLSRQKQLARLKTIYTEQQEKIMLSGKKFVPPGLMAKALSDVLSQNNTIMFIKLDTLPVTPLVNLLDIIKFKGQRAIYKHGLSLTFSSDYLTTLTYLKSLEALPWHFLWDSIEYTVKNYPYAEITLRVYTLSFEENWLDV